MGYTIVLVTGSVVIVSLPDHLITKSIKQQLWIFT